MSAQQELTFVCAAPPLEVTALRGQAPPVPTGGFGGWTEVARPRRKALTQWAGISPLREIVSMTLDGFRADESVEDDCLALERMARPHRAGGEPPLVRVLGILPHADTTWVIESFDWDPQPVYSASGYRVRQEVTVHLLEYVDNDRLVDVPAAEQRRRRAVARAAAAARAAGAGAIQATGTYIVKAGDTLQSIAARKLGSWKRWQEIADLNGIRDPRSIVPGEVLRLP